MAADVRIRCLLSHWGHAVPPVASSVVLRFRHAMTHIGINNACVLRAVNGKLDAHVSTSSMSLPRLMNRTPRIRLILVPGRGTHWAGMCVSERSDGIEQRASAQAGVATTE